MTYWYFNYEINNNDTGAHIKDDGVIMSVDDFFPIGCIMDMCRETFGEGYKLTLLNTVRISEESFDHYYDNTEGSDVNDLC